jgi:hypothetical protein
VVNRVRCEGDFVSPTRRFRLPGAVTRSLNVLGLRLGNRQGQTRVRMCTCVDVRMDILRAQLQVSINRSTRGDLEHSNIENAASRTSSSPKFIPARADLQVKYTSTVAAATFSGAACGVVARHCRPGALALRRLTTVSREDGVAFAVATTSAGASSLTESPTRSRSARRKPIDVRRVSAGPGARQDGQPSVM